MWRFVAASVLKVCLLPFFAPVRRVMLSGSDESFHTPRRISSVWQFLLAILSF
jgi:hypothetical protein